MQLPRTLLMLPLLVVALMTPACGGDGPAAEAAATATELFEGHHALGDEGRYDEAAGVLDRLQQLALSTDGTTEDRQLFARALVHRVVDGLREREPIWIRDALGALQRLASRDDSTAPIVHSMAEGLVRAHDFAWSHDDPDTGAELLNDIVALAQATQGDEDVRRIAAQAWDRAHLAGMEREDTSLRTTAQERLRKTAHAEGAIAAERQAYLAAIERMHEMALGEDHHLESDLHRKAVRKLLAAGASEAREQAVLVRMLTSAALQQTGKGRKAEALELIEEAGPIAGPLLDQPETASLTPWFLGQQHLVYRTVGAREPAQAALADLRKRARADEAPLAVVQRLALALAYEMRYVATAEGRNELLEELHALARQDTADAQVMMTMGRGIQQAALRAHEDGQSEEASAHVERLRKGTTEASSPEIRAELSALLTEVEGQVEVSPDDVPR